MNCSLRQLKLTSASPRTFRLQSNNNGQHGTIWGIILVFIVSQIHRVVETEKVDIIACRSIRYDIRYGVLRIFSTMSSHIFLLRKSGLNSEWYVVVVP